MTALLVAAVLFIVETLHLSFCGPVTIVRMARLNEGGCDCSTSQLLLKDHHTWPVGTQVEFVTPDRVRIEGAEYDVLRIR